MECDKTKKILSLVLLIAAVLVYLLTEWTIWIPIVLLILAIVRFFCKCKCKVCSPKTETLAENPLEEKESEVLETEESTSVEEEKPVEASIEVPVEEEVEEIPEIEVEKELE
jgi:hypothetical protein